MRQTICNMCGKPFDFEDNHNGLNIEHTCGYPSKFDNDRFRLDLCVECTDNEIKQLIEKCKHNPLVERY